MSDEFDSPEPQQPVSAFWPLLITIFAILVFFGTQDYELNRQRAITSQNLEAAQAPVEQARAYAARYVSLMKDLADTGQKNAIAAQIIRDAAAAGWIQVHPNDTNAAPASTTPPPAAH